MSNEIPPVNLPKATDENEKNFNAQAAAGESSYAYGKFYQERANEIKIQKGYWFGALVMIFAIAIFSSWITKAAFESFVEIIHEASIKLWNPGIIKPEYVNLMYIFCKISILGFLSALFFGVARIYSQLRRLEIVYRDKYIIARTYERFIQNSNDSESHAMVRQHALKFMFSSSLEQSERNAQKKSVHLNLGELMKINKERSVQVLG